MLLTILGIIVALIAIVLVIASTKPSTFEVDRSIQVNASAATSFPYVNDFHRWGSWSPYEKLDPGMQRTFGGPSSGVGSTYAWTGNNKVGVGRMEILESNPDSRIDIKLDFLKPFEAHNTARFTFQPQAGGTQVTWSTFGPMTFVTKIMCIFMNMDNLIGPAFAEGLQNLKQQAEGSSP